MGASRILSRKGRNLGGGKTRIIELEISYVSLMLFPTECDLFIGCT